MMKSKPLRDAVKHLSFSPLFAALALGLLSQPLRAQVSTDLMEARGYFKLGGDPEEFLLDSNTWSVDVLSFPGGSDGKSHAGLHSYGSQYGNFGSRSSGYGVYDVTGSFRIVQTVTNYAPTAQNVRFSFYITPGLLQNDLRSAFSGAQFVEAGLNFDIRRDGSQVWSSSAELRTDTSGTSFSSSGTDLYSNGGDPGYYTIAGGNYEVDMGVLGAGESLQLSYTLSTYARGDALGGADLVVPPRSFVVPEQWVDFCGQECGYGYGGYGGYGFFQPGDVIEIPGYTIPGQPSGSHASSGDPFTFNFTESDGEMLYPPTAEFNGYARLPYWQSQAYSVSFTQAVPEPSSYAMLALGLLSLGWLARRRRQQDAAAAALQRAASSASN